MFIWQLRVVCFLTREYDTGKQWGRRGRTGGLPNCIIELPPVPIHPQLRSVLFLGGRGGGGGGRRRRQQLEFSNLSFLKVFTDYLAPDDTSGVLSIISVEKSAACDLRVPYVGALSGLGRIFWGYFPPQPGSDYGGRRHSLWRCVRALWGHWQVSVALLISLIVLWLTLVFGLSNYLRIISYDYGTRADACTQTHAPKAW